MLTLVKFYNLYLRQTKGSFNKTATVFNSQPAVMNRQKSGTKGPELFS
jgi:hypothetical protein